MAEYSRANANNANDESNPTPALPEEKVVEELAKWLYEASYQPEWPNKFENIATLRKVYFRKTVTAFYYKLRELGYRSPSEVQEAERAAVERVFKEFEKLPLGINYQFYVDTFKPKYDALKSELLGEQGK